MRVFRRKRRPFTYAPAFAVAIVMLIGGYLIIRQTAVSAPTSKALEAYLNAGRTKQCAKAWSFLSERTRQLMVTVAQPRGVPNEAQVMDSACSYTPGSSHMETFIPGSSRTETVDGTKAIAYAKYKYDRFFGFFGEGTAKQRFQLVKERGQWRVDYTEEVDPRSRSNLDEEALRVVYQGWTAVRGFHGDNGYVTADPALIMAQLPGYRFGPIVPGVAGASTPEGTLHVAVLGRDVACFSTRSGSGTLVMVKMMPGAERKLTYAYGSIPRTCNNRPLERDYPGYSAKIRYQDR